MEQGHPDKSFEDEGLGHTDEGHKDDWLGRHCTQLRTTTSLRRDQEIFASPLGQSRHHRSE